MPLYPYPGSSVYSMTGSCQLITSSTPWLKLTFLTQSQGVTMWADILQQEDLSSDPSKHLLETVRAWGLGTSYVLTHLRKKYPFEIHMMMPQRLLGPWQYLASFSALILLWLLQCSLPQWGKDLVQWSLQWFGATWNSFAPFSSLSTTPLFLHVLWSLGFVSLVQLLSHFDPPVISGPLP